VADVTILAEHTGGLPTAYGVPNAQEIAPKMVRAVFDGTGASGSFLPVLQIVNDAGIIVGESALPTVAAGGSVDATWFPGAIANVNNGEACYLWGVAATQPAITSGGSGTFVHWNHFQTTNSTIFGTDTSGAASPPYNNASGDSYLYFNKNGYYMASMTAEMTSGAYAQFAALTAQGSQWDLNTSANTATPSEDISTNASPTGFVSELAPFSAWMFYVDSTAYPGITRVQLYQTSGSNKTLIEFNLGMFYLGGTTSDLAQVY
jgi:hypothetical protein